MPHAREDILGMLRSRAIPSLLAEKDEKLKGWWLMIRMTVKWVKDDKLK